MSCLLSGPRVLGKTIVLRQGVTRVLAIELPIGDRFTTRRTALVHSRPGGWHAPRRHQMGGRTAHSADVPTCCVVCEQLLARDPKPLSVPVGRSAAPNRAGRTQGSEQGVLISGDESRPGETVAVRLEPESPEPLVEEDRRRLERPHVAQPAPWACEPCQRMEGDKQLPSKFEADRDRRQGGVKCHDAIIVEVEDTDPVAATNGRAVGEVERSVTASDLDASRRPDL
jgi:hypothetical protein